MPFVSEKQRRYCWFLYSRAKSQGKKPKWDCREWEHATPKRSSKKGIRKVLKKRTKKSSFKKRK